MGVAGQPLWSAWPQNIWFFWRSFSLDFTHFYFFSSSLTKCFPLLHNVPLFSPPFVVPKWQTISLFNRCKLHKLTRKGWNSSGTLMKPLWIRDWHFGFKTFANFWRFRFQKIWSKKSIGFEKNLVSEKSLGFTFVKFGFGKNVSFVSEIFGLGKKSRFRFWKIWYQKKSLSIGFCQNFGIVIQWS